MITGQLPFQSDYEQAVIYSILNIKPESIIPIGSGRDNIPTELERIINKCLEKDKEYRCQRIDDVLINLRREKRETSGVSITPIDFKRTTTKVTRTPETEDKQKYIWLSSGIFIVIAAICALVFWPSGSNVQLNPERTIRTLNLPFKQIMYPSISADGNWIAFPAVDVDGDWNVYLSHASSGEPPVSLVNNKKHQIWSAQISPDGSYIMYDPAYPVDVRIISTSGGVPKILDSLSGIMRISDFQWKPDGARVSGSTHYRNQGKYELWTSSLEGTDLQRVIVDTVVGQKVFRNFDYAWSPDGKSIARIIDFEEGSGYQEIFIHEIETGRKKQITFAKSNIEAVCWSALDVIIFAATISGPLNLWMVLAEGGEPVQITSGDGPDGPPHISLDGSKLIYPKIKLTGQLMIVPLSGGEPELVTAGEQTVWGRGPWLSPDEQKIAVPIGDLQSGWVGARCHLYIMDRDGSNSRRIMVWEWENVWGYQWSPDGKWLAFASNQYFGDYPEVFDVYILNVAGNHQPKKISRFYEWMRLNLIVGLTWIDSLKLAIPTKNKFYTYSINEDRMTEDTLLYYPIKGKSEALIQDLEGKWWLTKNGEKHRLQPPDYTEYSHYARLSLSNLCWTQWGRDQPFRTISLIDGKITEYPELKRVKFPAEISELRYNLSYDGKEVVVATQAMQGQISIIENPFIK